LDSVKKQFRAFSLWASLALISTSLAGLYILTNFFPDSYFSAFPYLCAFFYSTSLLYYYLINRAKTKGENYAQLFLGLSGGKFIVYIVASLIFLFFNRDNAIPVAASLFGLYVIYQILELVFVLRKS